MVVCLDGFQVFKFMWRCIANSWQKRTKRTWEDEKRWRVVFKFVSRLQKPMHCWYCPFVVNGTGFHNYPDTWEVLVLSHLFASENLCIFAYLRTWRRNPRNGISARRSEIARRTMIDSTDPISQELRSSSPLIDWFERNKNTNRPSLFWSHNSNKHCIWH